MADFNLSGKVAWVTGGGSGLGRGAAEALAAAGARVVLSGRRGVVLEEAARTLAAAGGSADWIACDVSRVPDIHQAAAELQKRHERLDILVNSAGVNRRAPSLDLAEEDWDWVVDINLKGTFFCCQAAGRVMKARGSGKIINIASLASEISFPNIAAYASSKGGVRQLTKTLAVEWAPYRINVNAIGPGWFRTDLNEELFQNPAWVERVSARIPWGRTGIPGDLGGLVVFLASPASDYITGEVIYVDGGALAG